MDLCPTRPKIIKKQISPADLLVEHIKKHIPVSLYDFHNVFQEKIGILVSDINTSIACAWG